MTEPFTLDNAGAPPYKKPDAAVWKPHSQASVNRQTLHGLLQADITQQHSLDDLAIASGLPRKAVYAAARQVWS